MLEYRKTTRHVLMESYFSTSWLKTYAISADIDRYTSMFGQQCYWHFANEFV